MRNYEGYISAYTQPEHYSRHDPKSCPACQARAKNFAEAGQSGVSGLLAGERLYIAPEGFAATHERAEPVEMPPIALEPILHDGAKLADAKSVALNGKHPTNGGGQANGYASGHVNGNGYS
jgi:hypothetical protein